MPHIRFSEGDEDEIMGEQDDYGVSDRKGDALHVSGGSDNKRRFEARLFLPQIIIQASYGSSNEPDYVLDLTVNEENSLLAAALSCHLIKLYDTATGNFLGDCKGHKSNVSDFVFPDPTSPTILASSSSDGSVRIWDTRSRKETSVLQAGAMEELWSLSFGGSSGNLIAAGAEAKIFLWDWRAQRPVACLEDSHTEAVTQVRFHPSRPSKLLSASVDGLMCIFDTSGELNDDEGMDTVLAPGVSIAKIGFWGPAYDSLWCLTHVETLSLWDLHEGDLVADFPCTRAMASEAWNLSQVDYLVRCSWNAEEGLMLLAGNLDGDLGCFPLTTAPADPRSAPKEVPSKMNTGCVAPVYDVFQKAHESVIRSAIKLPAGCSEFGQYWTGGEDGRICSWKGQSDGDRARGVLRSSKHGRESRALSGKETQERPKLRHSPY